MLKYSQETDSKTNFLGNMFFDQSSYSTIDLMQPEKNLGYINLN